jgi:hypothetical protein
MENSDRRKFARVDVYSSISFVCVDEHGNIIDQHMGVAVNISQTGLLLETNYQLETNSISLMVVDLDNNLAEIEGQIMYSRPDGSGKYENGIHFRGSHSEKIEFAQKLIRAYHYRKSDTVLIMGQTAVPN